MSAAFKLLVLLPVYATSISLLVLIVMAGRRSIRYHQQAPPWFGGQAPPVTPRQVERWWHLVWVLSAVGLAGVCWVATRAVVQE